MRNQQYMQEDVIDIREYFDVLIKRKKLILAVFLGSIVIAAIVSLLMPKVYEISSTVQLGSVKELLINNKEAKEIILNQSSLRSIISQLDIAVEIERIKRSIRIVYIRDTDLLKIKVTYPEAYTAFRINEEITKPLIAQGQIIYQKSLDITDERLKELDMEIKNVEGDIKWTKNLISKLSKGRNMAKPPISLKIILMQETIPNCEKKLDALRYQKTELKSLLANAKDFKIFDAPIRPENPTGPKKKRIVLITGMFSLMLGVFLAFFLEFWQKNKR